MTVAELFRDGPIKVSLQQLHGSQARIGIEASKGLNVFRDELVLNEFHYLKGGIPPK